MVLEQSLNLKFAALADPTRRAIIARLTRGEATVSQLGAPFQLSQPAISKHLKVLEVAGLIQSGQSGPSRPRRLNVEGLKETADWLANIRHLWSDSFDRLDAFLASTATPPKED